MFCYFSPTTEMGNQTESSGDFNNDTMTPLGSGDSGIVTTDGMNTTTVSEQSKSLATREVVGIVVGVVAFVVLLALLTTIVVILT